MTSLPPPSPRHPNVADQSDAPALPQLLPEILPADPLAIFRAWFDEAHSRNVTPNPNAMALAAADDRGRPNVRFVLCKAMDLAPATGYLVFFTNYESRKSRCLTSNPRAAATFHWDILDRQVRIEGPVVRSPADESDAYFASRPVMSRISAWASRQSTPIDSRAAMVRRFEDTRARLGVTPEQEERNDASVRIPRPPHWGGWRLWIERVELWVGGPGRLHDLAVWERPLRPDPAAGARFDVGPWTATRLQP